MDEVIASVSPALQSKIGAFRKQHRLPGIAAGIATRDGLAWWHASGFADMESGRRLDERTLFRVASITKTVTATAVMQLRDDGCWASTTRSSASSLSSRRSRTRLGRSRR